MEENDYGFAPIQELREFESEQCDIVEEYIEERDCFSDPILVICHENRSVTAYINERRNVVDEVSEKNRKIYAISDFVDGDDINYDKLCDIATCWNFVR